jgi:hypothetical protein
LQLAHARRVDEQRATRQLHKVPGRRRVAPLAVHIADLGRFQQLVAKQPVYECEVPTPDDPMSATVCAGDR